MQKSNPTKPLRKPQTQRKPGSETQMQPQPVYDYPDRPGSGRLHSKIALITGGDSGIGKAVAILFAKEGADVAIVYLNEHKDAKETQAEIENYGRKCILIAGDISKERFCISCVEKTIKAFGRIDILVNNAATHFEAAGLEEITSEHLLQTFQTNVFSAFWITRQALRYMKRNSCIINTTSVTAYRGSGGLIDYAASKGAIVSFTRSLSANLASKGIRVNAVAPGPVWTPLIVSSFSASKVASFGSEVPLARAGQPVEIASSYLLLASKEGAYFTGQVLHPNGGEIING